MLWTNLLHLSALLHEKAQLLSRTNDCIGPEVGLIPKACE